MSHAPEPATTITAVPDAGVLRTALADKLAARAAFRTAGVEAALRRVPRHLFVPEASLEEAYADDVVVTKRDADGKATSSLSAPWLQAMMLEDAALAPGHRVLEIGSGGYNAALIAELVGPAGEVTTLDIDPFVTERASRFLADTGYDHVNVVLGDGEHGAPGHAPEQGFDAIIVTVQAWDIPTAWIEQLAEGGRLVVPLLIHGYSRGIALEKRHGRLVSRAFTVCGFVPMQGSGAHHTSVLPVRGDQLGVRFEDGEPVDVAALADALRMPHVEVRTGVTVLGEEPYATLQLWLATTSPGFCRLAVDPGVDTGLAALPKPRDAAAVTDGDNLAYLTYTKVSEDPAPGRGTYEFLVLGYGPQAQRLADAMAERVRVWDRDHRGGAGPTMTVVPRATPAPDGLLPDGSVIDKDHARLHFTWTGSHR
ncbi:methyltransferase, FxLD system [Streptomyces sp. NPDC059373]